MHIHNSDVTEPQASDMFCHIKAVFAIHKRTDTESVSCWDASGYPDVPKSSKMDRIVRRGLRISSPSFVFDRIG